PLPAAAGAIPGSAIRNGSWRTCATAILRLRSPGRFTASSSTRRRGRWTRRPPGACGRAPGRTTDGSPAPVFVPGGRLRPRDSERHFNVVDPQGVGARGERALQRDHALEGLGHIAAAPGAFTEDQAF